MQEKVLKLSYQSAYAALAVQTRELLLINMWAGQFLCEGVSWLLKRAVKQDRPEGVCTLINRPPPTYADFVPFSKHRERVRLSIVA